MRLTVPAICQLYLDQGHALYDGELVTQLEHALQCAVLAETADQSSEMIVACLLHDLGHLLHSWGESAADRGIDDRHEYRAIPALRHLFGPAVTGPIRLHVQAKRYLCAVDRTYYAELSAASKQSLTLQGKIFSDQEASTFIAQPYAQEAVQLRRWDDQAKIVGVSTPPLEHFIQRMSACLLPSATAS
jgi:phosphonate degradation associated HDIG domain protein